MRPTFPTINLAELMRLAWKNSFAASTGDYSSRFASPVHCFQFTLKGPRQQLGHHVLTCPQWSGPRTGLWHSPRRPSHGAIVLDPVDGQRLPEGVCDCQGGGLWPRTGAKWAAQTRRAILTLRSTVGPGHQAPGASHAPPSATSPSGAPHRGL